MIPSKNLLNYKDIIKFIFFSKTSEEYDNKKNYKGVQVRNLGDKKSAN